MYASYMYSSLIHVTLDQYKQKKTEDELYSDVNFIMQEETGECLVVVLRDLVMITTCT